MSEKAAPQAPQADKRGISFYIHLAIGLFMMFGFAMVFQPFGPLTDVGMQVFGIFIGLIWMWTFIGMLWPSLLGIVALGLSDFSTFNAVLASGFGNNVANLVLFAMILFGAPQAAGVTKYIVRWFLTRKVLNGRPLVFCYIFMLCAYVMGTVALTPTILLMWAIMYGTLAEVGYKPRDKFSTIMVFGTLFAAVAGQAAFPFTGAALMILGAFEGISGIAMPPLPYIIFGFIMSNISILVFTLLIKFVFRPDMSKLANVNIEMFNRDPLPPMSKQQKFLFGFMIAFLALTIAPSILPDGFIVTQILTTMTTAGISILLVAIMCVVHADGKPIMNFKEAIGKYVNWDVYFLVVMAMAIAGALSSPATGITDLIEQALYPVLGGHSAIVFFALMLVVAVALTSFANTGVMGIMLMPAIVTFGAASGVNLLAMTAAVVFLMHYHWLLPTASPFGAMLFGNKEWIRSKDVFKFGGVTLVCVAIIFLVVGIPLSQAIFGLFGY